MFCGCDGPEDTPGSVPGRDLSLSSHDGIPVTPVAFDVRADGRVGVDRPIQTTFELLAREFAGSVLALEQGHGAVGSGRIGLDGHFVPGVLRRGVDVPDQRERDWPQRRDGEDASGDAGGQRQKAAQECEGRERRESEEGREQQGDRSRRPPAEGTRVREWWVEPPDLLLFSRQVRDRPIIFTTCHHSENTMSPTVAFVGVTGGAGTTRTSVESGATLARDGDSVAILDAAFGTQGLATYVDGRIDPDLTGVLTDEAAFADAMVDVWPALDGRAVIAPAHAPFERVARAKSPGAAQQFETCIDHAAGQFDHVIVDVPPVADNQSVAAVSSVDQRVLVAPDARRGGDLLPRMRGRLVDLGTESDALVANRVSDGNPAHLSGAEYVVPAGEENVVTPTCGTGDSEFAAAVADVTSDLFDRDIDVEVPSDGLFG